MQMTDYIDASGITPAVLLHQLVLYASSIVFYGMPSMPIKSEEIEAVFLDGTTYVDYFDGIYPIKVDFHDMKKINPSDYDREYGSGRLHEIVAKLKYGEDEVEDLKRKLLEGLKKVGKPDES